MPECKACYSVKPSKDFLKKRHGGYYSYCKECRAEYRQIRKQSKEVEKPKEVKFEVVKGSFDVSFE